MNIPLPVDLPALAPHGTMSEPDQGPEQYKAIQDLLAREGLLG